jgi:hypothetical protein
VTAVIKEWQRTGASPTPLERFRGIAWFAILIVDVGFLVWGAMAVLVPEHLLGPGSTPILTAGYEGFTGGSWSDLVQTSPQTAGYITLLFRTYGAFNVAFSVAAIALTVTGFRRGDPVAWWGLLIGHTIALGAAMTYDRIANAIGPFEVSEYVGLVLIYAALAVTAPFVPARRRVGATG